jgi:hypothetical protein
LSLSLSLSLTLYYSSSPQQTNRCRFPETNFPSNKPCPFPETIPPPNIILFFLSTGCGKSVSLAHVAHFCHLQNHIILNFRKIQNWFLLHQEVGLNWLKLDFKQFLEHKISRYIILNFIKIQNWFLLHQEVAK